jgi:hypothetical protein
MDPFRVLQKGQEVANVVPAKQAGVAVSIVSMLLSSGFGYALSHGWLVDEVPAETVFMLSSVLVSAAMAFLSWVQLATTKRIGL